MVVEKNPHPVRDKGSQVFWRDPLQDYTRIKDRNFDWLVWKSYEDVAIMNGVAASTPSLKDDSIGGGGGGGFLSQIEEEKPFYTTPLFIGGAVIGGFLLFQQFRKK